MNGYTGRGTSSRYGYSSSSRPGNVRADGRTVTSRGTRNSVTNREGYTPRSERGTSRSEITTRSSNQTSRSNGTYRSSSSTTRSSSSIGGFGGGSRGGSFGGGSYEVAASAEVAHVEAAVVAVAEDRYLCKVYS